MKYKLLGLVLFCGLMVTSCKNELQQVAGEYSYKISGSVVVDTVEERLTNESGALHLINTDDEELLLTFNMLGGDVYTTNADLENKQLKIAEFERIIFSRSFRTDLSIRFHDEAKLLQSRNDLFSRIDINRFHQT